MKKLVNKAEKSLSPHRGESERGRIIIGSRGSELALWQANHVRGQLLKINVESEIKIIKTQGDKVQDIGFDKMEGKGFFTKEIEDALIKNEIDLAVHSHKDLPTESPKGLMIAAVSLREDPSELILIRKDSVDEHQKFSLKKNAVIGTSSARRKSQLIAWRDDLKITDLRGNVPTRIQKLRDKKYDAIMIAAAGVERLEIDLSEFHSEKLNPKEFVPAPAQGVLALQIRETDKELGDKLRSISNKEVEETILIERKVLNLFDGGCSLPLGVYCEKDEDADGNRVFNVWTSKADAWDKTPKYLFTQATEIEKTAEGIVNKIKGIKPSSVFITRDSRKNDFFTRVLSANGYSVFNRSLIEIKPIDFKKRMEGKKMDWVFFSSKNAVPHFFDQKPVLENVKYGVIGKATADALRKYGKRADFIGQSTDTKLIGKQFAALAGSKMVLFPQAKGSMKGVQQQFTNPVQVIDLIVYETIKKNEEPVPKSEIIVFTSPSNVEAFFEKNKMDSSQKAVAMGDATAHTLTKFGVRRCKQPISFDDMGLLQAVFGS